MPPRPTLPLRMAIEAALILMLVALWLATHRYQGLAQDARLYAMQALSTMEHALGNDLYLQTTSQDRYTIFSPFYAAIIRVAGLVPAARILTLLFTMGFLTAAWALAQTLVGRNQAWLGVGLLILSVGAYGSYGVFHFSEDFLTARLPAEMLIAAALLLHYRGSRPMAMLMAAGAMFVHPLIALPGLVLLICLNLSTGAAAALLLSGWTAALALALAASTLPAVRRALPLLDAQWLLVVRERSQFLFLQLWSWRDWEVNARPFASLELSAMVLNDPRVQKLCRTAVLVGASGLAVAALAGSVGPVALLVQGQAWRWVWVSGFVAALLTLPTAIRLWQDRRCGPLCAILLIASWSIPAFHGPSLALAALAVFLARTYMNDATASYLRWAACAAGLALLCAMGAELHTAMVSPPGPAAGTSFLLRSGAIAAIRLPLLIGLVFLWHRLASCRSVLIPAAVALGSIGACMLLIPVTFGKGETAGTPAAIAEFVDWRDAIPPAANVYVADGHDAPPFTWFTLHRPSYLSVDQSAGVIFSRATALEVRRRSQVLSPLMTEDWKLLSKIKANRIAGPSPPRWAALTADRLVSICADAKLGFVIAREDLGFAALRHSHAGPWRNWNLYDCAHVRNAGAPSASPAA